MWLNFASRRVLSSVEMAGKVFLRVFDRKSAGKAIHYAKNIAQRDVVSVRVDKHKFQATLAAHIARPQYATRHCARIRLE